MFCKFLKAPVILPRCRFAEISANFHEKQNIIQRKKIGTSLDARRDPVVPRDIPRQGPRTACKMYKNIHFRTFIKIFKCFKYSYYKERLAQRFSQGPGMVYKIFMCVNTFVGHTDKNEKEKYFQNKYICRTNRQRERERNAFKRRDK